MGQIQGMLFTEPNLASLEIVVKLVLNKSSILFSYIALCDGRLHYLIPVAASKYA